MGMNAVSLNMALEFSIQKQPAPPQVPNMISKTVAAISLLIGSVL
jgi:hypothetical protein